MFKQIIYCSKLLPEYDLKEVYKILKTARSRNPELGLSGYLIYADGYFLQILEGVKAPLNSLMSKIYADPRHTDIKIIQEDDIKFLDFEKWAMGFANLVDDLGDDLKTYMEEMGQLNSFQPDKLTGEQAKKLLSLFANRTS
jgi:hypothetical protein